MQTLPVPRPNGHWPSPPSGRRSKNPVIPHQIELGRRNRCRQILKKIHRIEDHIRGPIPLNESWNRAISFLLPRQKGLQMLKDDSVQRIILRIPGAVCGIGVANSETFIPKFKTTPTRSDLGIWAWGSHSLLIAGLRKSPTIFSAYPRILPGSLSCCCIE
jgi:hypothetical protein